MNIHTYIYIYVFIYVCMFICMCVCVCVYVCVYVCMRVCMYNVCIYAYALCLYKYIADRGGGKINLKTECAILVPYLARCGRLAYGREREIDR
jgi:hypothetical protein